MKAVLMTSSILIVLTAALRPVLRGKIDPRAQYALWLAAALRLLIPVNFADSAYSALALLERADRGQDIVETIGRTTVPIPGMSYEDAYDQALREYHQDRPAATSFTDLAEVERRAQEIQAKGPTLADLAAKYARPVWLGGAAVMGLWFLLVNLRLRRRLRWALPVEADCPLPVRVTPELPSPCLCGAVRPAIYITPAALESPDRLRHVLAHELTHYRHRDHWWALVRCLCLCVYWFDPLVWWAAALSRQDCELACDEGAIRRLGEAERLPYGRTLVDMIAAGRTPLLQTATTMTGGKRRIRERIKLIARRPKTAAAAALALVIVLGLAVGCTFTGAPEKGAAPMGLSTETLQERLLDVPEELRASVVASASETKWAVNDIALASYWWDVPAEWESERDTWLLDVHRLEKEGIETYYDFLDGWFAYNDDCAADLIAQDEEFFYVVERPLDKRFRMEDYEPFAAAYEAIREFAVQTVLETEGVEPYSGQSMDTLRARLNNIPIELQGDVVTGNGHDDSPELVSYWMNREWTNMDNSGLGFLLRVYTLTPEEYEVEFVNQANYGAECFARSDGVYYIIASPTDARYYTNDDEPDYFNAYDAIRAYAMQTVLDTEGVEYLENPQLPPAPWEADPTQFILDNLNAAFSDGELVVRVFFSHGSGPATTAVLDSECGQEIRELFSSYDWEVTQRPSYEEGVPYLSFGVDFRDLDAPYNIGIDTYSNALSMFPFDDSMDRLYFRADGAENLSWDIASLCPDPRVQCALVRCPAQETRESTARLFMDDFFTVMLENGHIADYELVRLDMLRENPDYSSMITFNVRFRLKAAHPEWDFWTNPWLPYISVDESGWTNTMKWKVNLVTDDVAGGDGEVYVIDWIS